MRTDRFDDAVDQRHHHADDEHDEARFVSEEVDRLVAAGTVPDDAEPLMDEVLGLDTTYQARSSGAYFDSVERRASQAADGSARTVSISIRRSIQLRPAIGVGCEAMGTRASMKPGWVTP